jgi:hypothetical protein
MRMSKKVLIAAMITVLVGIIFAIAMLAYFRATFQPSAAPCVNRLMQIDAAKQEWALEHGKTANDVPTWDDLYPYLESSFTNRWFTNGQPVCPEGGTCHIGRVGMHPTCSIGGPRHSYPQ